MSVKSHEELEVWQRATDLVVESYAVAQRLPKFELFGLASQLRRASVSIPANIAEGHGRLHRGDYVRHVSIALGSLRETTMLLSITMRLGYLAQEDLAAAVGLADRVGQMLHKLASRLRP